MKRLKSEISSAQGVVFVTPEYNRSVPGVMKNAIDAASLPYGQNAWAGKPAGILSASMGPIGAAMAQQHLRNILTYLDMPTLAQPEAFMRVTKGFFDASGGIGPWIQTQFDLTKPLHLTVRKNGEVTQDDTTASMIFSFADIIAYTTSFMTLKAGDVICTGTPVKKTKADPPIWLKPGDTIEIECPEIGLLSNTVADEA